MNPNLDFYFEEVQKWQASEILLRTAVLDCGLVEVLKWGVPCYMHKQNNIVLIHHFKDYCAVLFAKGALLSDTENLLIQQTENVQAGRQMRFKSKLEVIEKISVLKTYIYEAIEVENAGLKIDYKQNKDLVFPDEFLQKLNENLALKTAFEALTPGRQRAYHLYFSEPKQSKTRETRVEKYIQQIINGKGLNDCTCGLSRRMPNCDGSHKNFMK